MNVNGITASVNPYVSTGRKINPKYRDGQFYQQTQAAATGTDETKQYASPQDIYEAQKLTAYYKGKSMEEWALTDPKYTDPETGISWYVRDGKHPYMTGEDSEKFRKLCEESGEFYLKKFAEMTGLIQYLDDKTVAYVGDNGTAIKSKDGKELWIDTSSLSYDMIMNMFRNISKTGNYFDSGYWSSNIWNAQYL